MGYGIQSEMGMFVVAPATSFQQHHHPDSSPLMLDPHHHHNYHHHHHQHQQRDGGDINGATALGVGVGVIPLLTASSGHPLDEGVYMGRNRGGSSALQLWQTHHQQQQQQQHHQIDKKGISFDHGGGANLLPSSSTSGLGCGTTTCQDCGNQAKKDCSHRRCRTCCRSRGFDCSTHVKSTWVPAARRRERQMIGVSTATGTHIISGGGGGPTTGAGGGGGGGGGASSGSTSGAKKPRLISSQNTTTTSHTSTSNNTPPRSFETTSSHQDASFKESLPGQVKAPAVFKCVKVTAVEDGEDEFAYQAVVKIGGHVFKGFLYDQGSEPRDGFPNLSDLHLGGGGSGRNNNNNNNHNGGASSSTPLLDPSDVYGASGSGGGGGGLFGSSTYGNTIN